MPAITLKPSRAGFRFAEKDCDMRTIRRLSPYALLLVFLLPASAAAIELNVTTRLLDAAPQSWIRYDTTNRRDTISVVSNDRRGDDVLVTLMVFSEILEPYSSHVSLHKYSGRRIRELAVDLDEDTTVRDGEMSLLGEIVQVKVLSYTYNGIFLEWYVHDAVPLSGVARTRQYPVENPDAAVGLTISGYGWEPDGKLPDPATATDIKEEM